MTCETCRCQREAEKGHLFPYFCPTCIWCGARYVWSLRARPKTAERDTWIGNVLADWEAHGHSRAKLREMALAQTMPVEPKGAK